LIHQTLGAELEVEAGVLPRLAPCHCRDALHEIEHGSGGMPFLGQHRVDHPRRVALGKATPAQELGPVFVRARDDFLPRRPDAADEGSRARVGETVQGRRGLAGEARRGIFRVADRDLLERLGAP